MICKKSSYTNFRNIEEQTISFDKGTNIICGENAQGKTNSLEGIFLCAQGRSHRSSKERDFIRFNSEFARVAVEYSSEKRDDSSLSVRYLKSGRKYCEKNGVPVTKMSSFIGNFRAILFTPEHLSIVKSGPSDRRKFLDCALSQLYPSYVSDLQMYGRALMQRNKLLQEAAVNRSVFSETGDLWSEKLAILSEKISAVRDEYVNRLSLFCDGIFADMTNKKEKLTFTYRGRVTKEQAFACLTENTEREIRYGSTLSGIHKDDIEIKINDREARIFASQGQQRSAALSMKIAEGEISKLITGEYPVFLFDDILSELDKNRRDYIMSGISGRQVIITTCEEINALEKDKNKVILCKEGKFFE